jgi:hypothetical protein
MGLPIAIVTAMMAQIVSGLRGHGKDRQEK